MKSKLLLYVLIAVAIVAIGAFIIYQLVYRGGGAPAAAPAQTGTLPGTPSQQFPTPPVGGAAPTSVVGTFNAGAGATASSSKFGIVSTDQALDYFVDAANTVWLVKPDGTIESVSNGKPSIVSGTVFQNIANTAFSYDGKKLLISSRIGTTTQSSVFDLAARTWNRLPDNMQSPVWSPLDYRIAYLNASSSGTETLMTLNETTTTAKPVPVITFSMEDIVLQWPSKNSIIISDKPSAYTAGSVWLFDIPSKTLTAISREILGTETLWSASGSALVFSAQSNSAGGTLAFRDASGAQKTLSFATLPSKCVFAPPSLAVATSTAPTSTANPSSLIYCAVPQDQGTFSLARLPDEYDQMVYFTNDYFYRIDTGTGSLTQIFSFASANQNIDAERTKVFGNVLFFVNRYDQKIYAIAL